MILTDREITIALKNGTIKIDPLPDASFYSSTSVDLTLDDRITTFKQPTPGLDSVIDPQNIANHQEVLDKCSSDKVIDSNKGYDLNKGSLILAWTKESIDLNMRARLAARVEGKSLLARFGVGIHITAPTIHAGFNGRIRLEITNHGVLPVKLRAGMRVCQLIFEQTLGTPDKGYGGRFQDQTPAV